VRASAYPGGREVCHDFQNGRCFRGESCRFDHSAPPGGMPPPPPMGYAPAPYGGGGGGDAAPAPGDWFCASCSASNFARRGECFKCNAPRPAADAEPPRERRYSRSRSRSRSPRRRSDEREERSRSPRRSPKEEPREEKEEPRED